MCLCQDWLSMDLMDLPPGGLARVSGGAGHVLHLTDKGLVVIGTMTLPSKWQDGLPSGAFSALDAQHWVAGRLDRRGCNVYTVGAAGGGVAG